MPAPYKTNDQIALELIESGELSVDTESGEIWRGTERAETHAGGGYGNVYLGKHDGKNRHAKAHRVVWLAANGPIPPNLVVNHRNRRRWDNRLANLDVTSSRGNYDHAAGLPYPAIGDDGTITGPEPSLSDGSWMMDVRVPVKHQIA